MKLHVKTIFILFFFLPFIVNSQSLERQVFSSTGSYAQTTEGSLSYTVGEPVTIQGMDGSTIVTQGFQQPNINFSMIIQEACSFLFYPNPTQYFINIETSITDDKFELFDVIGRSYGYFSIAHSGGLDVTNLAAGLYFIKVNCDSSKSNYYKFIKI